MLEENKEILDKEDKLVSEWLGRWMDIWIEMKIEECIKRMDG